MKRISMKEKIGLLFLFFGIALIGVGIYINDQIQTSIKNFNIDDYVENQTLFVKTDDNSFGFIKILKNDNTYALQIKMKKYLLKDNNISIYYSLLKYPVSINENKLINNDEKFELEFVNDTFKFYSSNESNTTFNGKYKMYDNVDKEYDFPKLDEGKHTGIYECKDKEYATLFLNYYIEKENTDNGIYYTDGYYISGVVRNKGEMYVFANDKMSGSGYKDKSKLNRDGYVIGNTLIFGFKDDILTIQAKQHSMKEDKDSVVNGQYTRITKIAYQELIKEIDESVSLGSGVYGKATSN